MASKQYEMLFKLGAQLDQKFSGTFASAQKVLNATQKEIQALNKQQGDIASYQKQQAGLEKSKSQLELYKKQLEITRSALEKLNAQENKDEAQIAALSSKEQELCYKIQNTELAIYDKTKKLDDMRQKLDDAGVKTNDLTRESERLKNEMQQLVQNEEKAAQEAENFGDVGVSSAEAVASALAAAGIVNMLKKIYDAYKECVGISMEFDSTMSTVEALSGATAVEMKALTAQAKELGATTAFTANQSAQAMTYMGMAGWDASEMMSGLDGVISLAAASGEDLAMVSDIVTDNLTAFKLTAKDTAHFSDVLAQAASKSNTSVAIMGETFKGSASVAGALGYSIEDVAVAVGLMANSGVKGSIANTALKNTFNGLLNGATLTGKAFGEVEYTAVNADGTMKAFGDTIDELRGYFEQMTDAERVNNAMAIAGQRGYNGLLAILNATDEDYASLTASINNCSGAAQRMAEIKLDNLKGDVTLLDSAAEGLKNTIGGMYDEELRQLAQVGTQILTGINNFCEKHPAVVKSIMAIVGAFGAMVVINTGINLITKFGGALKGLLAMNPKVLAFTAVIAAASAVFIGLETASKKARLETLELTTASDKQTKSVERLNDEYEEACAKYGKTSDNARALKYDLDEATAALEDQKFSVSELYSEIDALHSSTEELLSSFNETTDKIAGEQEDAQILAAKLKEIANSSENAAEKQALIEPIVKRLNELYPELGLTVENAASKVDGLSDAIDRAAGTETMLAKYKAAKAHYADLVAQQQKLQEDAEKAEIAFNKAYFREKTFFEDIRDYSFVGDLAGKSDYTKDLEKVSEERQKVYSDLAEINKQISESEEIITLFGDTVNGTSEKTVSAYEAMTISIDGVTEQAQYLLQAYKDAYQAAYESVSGQYNLWAQAEESIPTSIDTINSALSSQQSYWDNYGDNLNKLLGKTDDIDGLRDILASFADGSKDSVNAIAGMANASDDQLKQMVENYQKAKEEEQKVSEALAQVKVDFEGELGEINDALAESVENMNLADDARKAAENTIDAYIRGIRNGAGRAGDAADAVSDAVEYALLGLSRPDDDETRAKAAALADTSGNAQNSLLKFMSGIRAFEFAVPQAYGPQLPAFASGTDNAPAGLALVGEEGPELVRMLGGEQVYTAQETKAMLGGGFKGSIVISPSFTISGDVGADTERKLHEFADQLVEMVKDAINEAGIDKQRSVYA